MRRFLPLLTAILLAACGGPEQQGPSYGRRGDIPQGNVAAPSERPLPHPQFGGEEQLSGIYETGFERSTFNGCWFSMTPEAVSTFRRIIAPSTAQMPRAGARYRLEVSARRSIDPPGTTPRYGEHGGWPCEIRAHRIITAAVVP